MSNDDIFTNVLAHVRHRAQNDATHEWNSAVSKFTQAVSAPSFSDPINQDMPAPQGRELFIARRVDEALGRFAENLVGLAF